MRLQCLNCNVLYTLGNHFCARCGGPLIRVPDSFVYRYRYVLVMIGVLIFGLALFTERDSDAPRSTSGVRTANATVDYDAALINFRTELMNLPEAEKMILATQPSPVKGVVQIQVSNLWYELRPFERRQLTQMLANLWRAELRGESAIIHVYDVTGREIAGTKAFGGVWIEDD